MSKEEITPCQMYVDNEHKEPASPVTKAKYVTLEGGQTVESYMSNNINEVNIDAQTNLIELDESTFDSPVSMTIKGNTLQNILPEPSTDWLTHSKPEFNLNEGVRSQSVYDINAVDGDMVDLRIQGNTIKNLAFETSPIEFEVNDNDNFATNQSTDTRYDIQDNYDYTVIKGKSVVNMLADTCGTPSKTVENEKDIIPDVNSALPITTTDGLYHENILYGKTLKNELVSAGTEIEEIHGSKRYSDDLGIQVSDNTNMDIAVIKGKTLVNLIADASVNLYLGWKTNNNSTVEITEEASHTSAKTTITTAGAFNAYVSMNINKQMIKPNTTYFFKLLSYNNPKNVELTWARIKTVDDSFALTNGITASTKLGANTFKATTISDFSGLPEQRVAAIFECSASAQVYDVGDVLSAYGVIVCEYQEGMENWDIPYFEGMQSVVNPEVITYNSPMRFGKGGRL